MLRGLRAVSKIRRLDQVLVSEKITKIYGPPGTGKTTTLINLVKHHIAQGVSPTDIGFFAFTNYSTKIAKDRIIEAFPNFDEAKDFNGFRTLHSLAYQALPSGADILTAEQAKEFDPEVQVEEVMIEEDNPSSIVYRPKHVVIDAGAVARSRLISLEHYLVSLPSATSYRLNKWLGYPANKCSMPIKSDDLSKILGYHHRYQTFKNTLGVIDYTDILELGCLQESSIPAYKVLFIDESQDLSDLQWAFAEKLFEKSHQIYLAGDDDQAICESFGAAPQTFLKYESKNEEFLEQSYRIPMATHEELFGKNGIIKILANAFSRKEKDWKPKVASSNIEKGIFAHCSSKDMLELIVKYPEKDWLVMSATHATLENVSRALKYKNISHFLSNKLINGITPASSPSIRLSTIWGAKGGEADITVLLRRDFVDEMMFSEDSRLIYVAQTRTKSIHLEVNTRDNRLSDLEPIEYYVRAQPKVERLIPPQGPRILNERPLKGEVISNYNSSNEDADPDTDIKLELHSLNKRDDEFDVYKNHKAKLLKVEWVQRGRHRGLALIMDDQSERVKLFGALERTFELAENYLIGRELVTAPVNPKKNHPLEWFNDIYLAG